MDFNRDFQRFSLAKLPSFPINFTPFQVFMHITESLIKNTSNCRLTGINHNYQTPTRVALKNWQNAKM